MPNKQTSIPAKHIKVKVGKRWLVEAVVTEDTSKNVTVYDVKSVKIAGVLITATAMTLMFWTLQYAVDFVEFVKSIFE